VEKQARGAGKKQGGGGGEGGEIEIKPKNCIINKKKGGGEKGKKVSTILLPLILKRQGGEKREGRGGSKLRLAEQTEEKREHQKVSVRAASWKRRPTP